MIPQEPNTITEPGIPVFVTGIPDEPAHIDAGLAESRSFTGMMPFETAKSLLSQKPLRRPNRIRPVEMNRPE